MSASTAERQIISRGIQRFYPNMPLGAEAGMPLITEQQAWDVAKFITTRPRPQAP